MSQKRKNDLSDEEDEEELDVYHYIALTGGQEWGRHPGETGAFPHSVPQGNYSHTAFDRALNTQYHDYWMHLFRRRIDENRPARDLRLAPSTELERAVHEARFRSGLDVRLDTHAPNPTARAVAHFNQVAQIAQQEAAAAVIEEETRARKALRSTPSPAPTTPGRPPMTPQRGAARPAFAQAVRRVGIAGGQGVAAAAQGIVAQIEGLNLEDPSRAQSRFGRALRNPNLSAHKRKKYTKIYNALSFL